MDVMWSGLWGRGVLGLRVIQTTDDGVRETSDKGSQVAERLRSRASNLKVASSIPGRVK